MEGVVNATTPSPSFWRGRRVFVTGHTGFKGGWLCLWLHSLGAEVSGYALDPPTEPNLFSVAGIDRLLHSSTIADVRDPDRLSAALVAARPEIVFHLAAQPIVRHSYQRPVETYAVNVMGVVHLLESVRAVPTVKAVVNVTTDKCYENHESSRGYREDEPLGGRDPYSSSKACAELVTAAYRQSFLANEGVSVATARAGNVIGGGDWAADRLVPDCLHAIRMSTMLTIRSPHAVRPWQHVLEPVSGYLTLAQRLYSDGAAVAGSWNFGPADEDARPVRWILEYLASRQPALRWTVDASPQPHEAGYLKLDSGKARAHLGWTPRWPLAAALEKTLEWDESWRRSADMLSASLAQIDQYCAAGIDERCGTT